MKLERCLTNSANMLLFPNLLRARFKQLSQCIFKGFHILAYELITTNNHFKLREQSLIMRINYIAHNLWGYYVKHIDALYLLIQ